MLSILIINTLIIMLDNKQTQINTPLGLKPLLNAPSVENRPSKYQASIELQDFSKEQQPSQAQKNQQVELNQLQQPEPPLLQPNIRPQQTQNTDAQKPKSFKFTDLPCCIILLFSVIIFWVVTIPFYSGHISFLLYGMNSYGLICGQDGVAEYHNFVYQRVPQGDLVCINNCPNQYVNISQLSCVSNQTTSCGKLYPTFEWKNLCQNYTNNQKNFNINNSTNLDFVRRQIYTLLSTWQLPYFTIAVALILSLIQLITFCIISSCKGYSPAISKAMIQSQYDEQITKLIQKPDFKFIDQFVDYNSIPIRFYSVIYMIALVIVGVLSIIQSRGIENIIVSALTFGYTIYTLIKFITKQSMPLLYAMINAFFEYYIKRHKISIFISFLCGLLFSMFFAYWYFVFLISFATGKPQPVNGQVLNNVAYQNLGWLQAIFFILFVYISQFLMQTSTVASCVLIINRFYAYKNQDFKCSEKFQKRIGSSIKITFFMMGSIAIGSLIQIFSKFISPITTFAYILQGIIGYRWTSNYNKGKLMKTVQKVFFCTCDQQIIESKQTENYINGSSTCCYKFLNKLIIPSDIKSFVSMSIYLGRVDFNDFFYSINQYQDEKGLIFYNLMDQYKNEVIESSQQPYCECQCLCQRCRKKIEDCCCDTWNTSCQSFFENTDQNTNCFFYMNTSKSLFQSLAQSKDEFNNYYHEVQSVMKTLKYYIAFVSTLASVIYMYADPGFASRIDNILFPLILWVRLGYVIASFILDPIQVCCVYFLFVICAKINQKSDNDGQMQYFQKNLLAKLIKTTDRRVINFSKLLRNINEQEKQYFDYRKSMQDRKKDDQNRESYKPEQKQEKERTQKEEDQQRTQKQEEKERTQKEEDCEGDQQEQDQQGNQQVNQQRDQNQ